MCGLRDHLYRDLPSSGRDPSLAPPGRVLEATLARSQRAVLDVVNQNLCRPSRAFTRPASSNATLMLRVSTHRRLDLSRKCDETSEDHLAKIARLPALLVNPAGRRS